MACYLRGISTVVIFHKKVEGLSEQSLEKFVSRARKAAGLGGTVDVVITGNSAMRTLNLRFRGKNKATDVLSFPSGQAGGEGRATFFAGEIAISAEIAAENAMRFGHPIAAEVKILALHGILHLAGMDHERDNGVMARKEASLRKLLRLPASLIQRAQPDPSFNARNPNTRAKNAEPGKRRRQA
jgi:probable rRNA maturation factor